LLLKFYHRMFQGILEMYTRERTLFWGRRKAITTAQLSE
jgi:hypothetical protein